MTDRDKGDHWGQLASELGAEVREEAAAENISQAPPEAELPPPDDTVPASQAAPAKVEKPRRPRPAANWDSLADALGIELPPEPVARQPEAGSLEQPEPQLQEQPPVPTISTEQLAETVEGISECWKAAPASLEHEPTVLIAHETVAVFTDPGKADVEESGERGEEERPARSRSKRRRRRRPRAADKPTVPDESGTEPKEPEPKEPEPVEPEPFERSEGGDAEADEDRRSKRRRPRRRRQKADPASPKAGTTPEAERDDFDETDDFDEADDLRAGGEKPGHRSIPAWQEAVGVIVEKNIESRSKKPDGGQSQRRGGRRSGRRGGG